MQTFLWHPLTPKCTWPSQNKSKKTLRKYWENLFRNYALFYMQGVGIFTEITVFCISLFAIFTFLQLAVTTSASDPQAFSLKVLTPQSKSKSKSSFPLTWNWYIGHRCTLLVTLWSTLEIPIQRSRTLWRGILSPKKFSFAPYNKIILVLLTW